MRPACPEAGAARDTHRIAPSQPVTGTRTCTGTHTLPHAHRACVRTDRSAYTDARPHTHASHSRAHSHARVNVAHHTAAHTLCPTCAGTPVHPHTHVSTEGSHTCIYGHPHVHTHQSAQAQVCTHPTTPGLGQGPGNPSRGSTALLAEPWPPRASARAGLPPPTLHPRDPVCNKKPDAETGENCSFEITEWPAVISQMERALPQTRHPGHPGHPS